MRNFWRTQPFNHADQYREIANIGRDNRFGQAATFNTDAHTVVDHFTYVIASDGDLMEGVSNEASALAGHLGRGKLVVLYDDNEVTIDGHTDLSFSEDVPGRYEALGWHVQHVEDGNCDMDGLRKAIDAAVKWIRSITDDPEVGEIYQGTVVKTVDFGAFVNFFGAKDGLVHISQLADERVGKATDVVKEGDKVWVKLMGFDERGKVRLSMKVVDQETGKEIEKDNAE